MRAHLLATVLALSSSLSSRAGCGVLANSLSIDAQQKSLEQLQKDLAATRADLQQARTDLAKDSAYTRVERDADDQYKKSSEARMTSLERRIADLEAALALSTRAR